MATTRRDGTPAGRARLLAEADRSEAVAEAYRTLAVIIGVDPRFEVLRELEVDRMARQAVEYAGDAEDRRNREYLLAQDARREAAAWDLRARPRLG